MSDITEEVKELLKNDLLSSYAKEEHAKKEYDDILSVLSVKKPYGRYGWQSHFPPWIDEVWGKLDGGTKILLYLVAAEAQQLSQSDPDIFGC